MVITIFFITNNIYSFDATFQIYAFPTRRFELSLYFSKNLT
jgi:hypothetical protein